VGTANRTSRYAAAAAAERNRPLPSFITLILIALAFLLALTVSLFAAFTYGAVSDTRDDVTAKVQYCKNYYEAETIATEILTGFSDSENQKTTSDGNRTTYTTEKGDILVIKADSGISFSVPISDKEELKVTAINNGSSIDIIQWMVE
jgi:hypothetical protein